MSTFTVYENWRWHYSTPKSLGGSNGEKYYHVAEVTFNYPLFHVDAYCVDRKAPGLIWCTRFITSDVSFVLQVKNDDKLKKVEVTFQSRRFDNEDGEYHMSPLTAILEGHDTAGQPAHIFVCKDGSRYVRCNIANDEREVFDLKRVF